MSNIHCATLNRKDFFRASLLGAAAITVSPRNIAHASKEAFNEFEPIRLEELTAIPVAGKIIVEAVGDNGVKGYGEPSPMLSRNVMAATINENIAPILIGKHANDIERLWDDMFVQLYKIGPQGHLTLAMSGVDLALYDLVGKSYGLPVYQLLGGKFRDRVKVYASSISRFEPPERCAEIAVSFIEAGYDHTKLKMGTRWGRNAPPVYDEITQIRAITEAIGPGKLAVDANGAYTTERALELAEEMKNYGVLFFEEPCPPYDLQGLAEITRRSPIPISTGESAQTKYQFRDLITHKAAHILQPDVQKSGGLLECKKIAALAEAWNLRIIVHSTQVPMGALATLHFCCTVPHCNDPQEFHCGNPARTKITSWQGIHVAQELSLNDSSFAPPDVPGMGYEIDVDWLARHREDR